MQTVVIPEVGCAVFSTIPPSPPGAPTFHHSTPPSIPPSLPPSIPPYPYPSLINPRLSVIHRKSLPLFPFYSLPISPSFLPLPASPQPPVTPVDELGCLVYEGRWGIHGVSLPGRVTFKPGNSGYATFGAPRPMQVRDTV